MKKVDISQVDANVKNQIAIGGNIRNDIVFNGKPTVQIGSLIWLNDEDDAAEIHQWIFENCNGKVYSRGDLVHYFELDSDALAFKLKWL